MTGVVKAKRGRKSKAELQEEFEAIKEESIENNGYSNPKAQEIIRQRELEIVDAVKELSVEGILRKFADLNAEISKTFSILSEKIVTEVNLFTTVRQAVGIETKELEKIHKMDVAQASVEQLLSDYSQQKESLDREIQETKIAWEQEDHERAKDIKEADDAQKKQRQRENEEYEYKKNLERRKAQDKYEEEIRLRDKQNRDHQEALEKNWQLREASIKEKEEEFIDLKRAVEEFPAKLKTEIDRSVTTTTKLTEQKFSQEILLLKRDCEADKKMSEFKIKSLEEIIARQNSQINTLQTQVEEAKKQVQDIAVKAIEGASGSKALSHINQIAMEQAKTRSGAP